LQKIAAEGGFLKREQEIMNKGRNINQITSNGQKASRQAHSLFKTISLPTNLPNPL
jgi:hypothetical protein